MAYKILITGHPRSGTAHAAAVCRKIGLDVGHEKHGVGGISCWAYATAEENPPWSPGTRPPLSEYAHFIHIVRNPWDVIRSVAYTENDLASRSYRSKYTGFLAAGGLFDQAACSVVTWNRMIEAQGPDVVIKVEESEEQIPWYFKREAIKPMKPTNSRKSKHGEFTPAFLSPMWRALVEQYALDYGYTDGE